MKFGFVQIDTFAGQPEHRKLHTPFQLINVLTGVRLEIPIDPLRQSTHTHNPLEDTLARGHVGEHRTRDDAGRFLMAR